MLVVTVLVGRPVLGGLVREARIPAEGVLAHPVVGTTFSVPSFDGGTVSIEVASRNISTTGVVTYGGRTPGSWLNNATVVMAKGGVVATVTDAATGHVFTFRHEKGGWTVRETEPSGKGRCGTVKSLLPEPAPSGGSTARLMAGTALTGNPLVDGAKIMKHGETVTNVIDVLVGVDRSAGDWIREQSQFAGMEDAVNLFAADAIARCNGMYANTDLDKLFTFNLVGVIEIGVDCSQFRDWWGDVDIERILDDMARGWATGAYAAAYKKVREKREAVCADIVSFLVSCGEEELEGTVGISFSLEDRTIKYEETSDVAYNVCIVEAVATDSTMAHEIGHIMGAGHADMKYKDISGPQLYGYSSGYYFTVTNADISIHGATVMAYGTDGFESDYAWQERWGPPPENVDPYSTEAWLWNNGWYTETEFFSSPNHTYKYTRADGLVVDSGVPLGDATHDNTRLLSLTYPLAANYRARKCSLAVVAPAGGEKSLLGSGMYAFGATATLAATPDADHVFAGWYRAYDEATGTFSEPVVSSDGTDYRSPTVKLALSSVQTTDTSGGQLVFYARFVDRASDLSCLSVELGQDYQTGRDGSFSLDLGACVNSLSLPSLAVSGLPVGVQYDAKTLSIGGTATKPGVYTVKVTVTNASTGKNGIVREFTLAVPNLVSEMLSLAGLHSAENYVLQGGVPPDLSQLIETVTGNGWKLDISGLPAGLKYDAKKGEIVGVGTKEGFSTVYFTATRGSGTDAQKEVATATFEVKFPTLAIKTEAWEDATATGSATGGGKYPSGKKVTLKATPSKASVFMGWFQGGELVSQNASYAYVTTGEDVTFTAMFITKEEDERNIKLAFNGADMSGASAATPMSTNITCGVALAWPVAVSALSEPKVKVAGLPAGLKFTDKPILKKGSKTEVEVPANTIYGAPSAASKVDKNKGVVPSEVKVTVTTAGKSSVTYIMKLTVDPLPAWAVGNFGGVVGNGSATMSVAASGKVSGKVSLDGVSWTFKADSLANMDCRFTGTATTTAAAFSTNFSVVATATAGKESRIVDLVVADNPIGYLPVSATALAKGSFGETAAAELCRLPWADKGDAAAAQHVATYAGAYSCEVACGEVMGTATFTLDEKGAIKGTAVLPNGAKARAASFAGSALPHGSGLYVAIVVPPDAKKGYPSIFEYRQLVAHARSATEAADGFAYRDPGVLATVTPLTAGSGASGTVSVSPKYGQVPAGKDISLAAKADKNSVFSSWIVDGADTTGIDLASPSVKFKASGGDIRVTALFVTRQEDQESISLFVDNEQLAGEVNAPGRTNEQKLVPCGVVVDWPVHVRAYSQATVKAEKLPDGLKLVQDKATKAYSIVGVPTKAAEFLAKFTVTTAGKSKETVLLPIKVEPVPSDVVGSYVGLVREHATETAAACQALGMVAISVAANGKLSAKATLPSGSYSFASNGWESAVGGVYKVTMETKAGDRLYLELDARSGCDWRSPRITAASALEIAGKQPRVVVAWRNEHGKDGKIASDAMAADFIARIVALKKLCYKVTSDTVSGYAVEEVPATDKSANLTVALDAKGNVKFSGKIDGTSISGSSVLNVCDQSCYTIGDVVVPLGKTEALCLALGFSRNADGTPVPCLEIGRAFDSPPVVW